MTEYNDKYFVLSIAAAVVALPVVIVLAAFIADWLWKVL